MLMIQVWKFARRSKRLQRLEDLQEDVLRQIFGLVVLADELVGDVEHLAPVLPDDQLPRHLIAGQALLDEAVRRERAERPGNQQTCVIRIVISYSRLGWIISRAVRAL